MTTDQLPALIGAISTLLFLMGGGIKWLLGRVESRIAASLVNEKEAREELSRRLNEEIRLLREDLIAAQKDKSLYLRRIYMLENFIHQQPGIEIPTMDKWPPE